MRGNKRGQVTIFVIVAILIVGSAFLFFVLRGDIKPSATGGNEANLNSFLDTCLEDTIEDKLNIVFAQGGNIDPTLSINFQFEGEEMTEITYLCYQENYYLPCVNQEPVFLTHLKDEIHTFIADEVENCLDELEMDLEKEWEISNVHRGGFDVDFDSRNLIIDFDYEITLSKNEESFTQKGLKVVVPTRAFQIAEVVQEIVSQEAKYCSFNKLGYMIIYPEWKIGRFVTGNSDKIYTIEHKKSHEKFKFATRGCVIPPGF
jgi:hypothetical protein